MSLPKLKYSNTEILNLRNVTLGDVSLLAVLTFFFFNWLPKDYIRIQHQTKHVNGRTASTARALFNEAVPCVTNTE